MWQFLTNGLVVYACLLFMGCSTRNEKPTLPHKIDSIGVISQGQHTNQTKYVIVERNILMKDYFYFIDSLADCIFPLDSVFNEYILINTNPWIIDSLRAMDYYFQKKKGNFIYDHSNCIILHKGDRLLIPDTTTIEAISTNLKSNRIVVNIPEYMLRVLHTTDTIFSCRVRIGRNAEAFLEYYQREADLRTPIGDGEIVTVRKKPKYFNLQTGEEYLETNRDDGRRTKMPIMPSLEPSINGKLGGTLIHATTNPRSLGKPYSHGCIGTSEADIWSIYYLCPPGTKVSFRYDLFLHEQHGKPIKLKDVYQLYSK